MGVWTRSEEAHFSPGGMLMGGWDGWMGRRWALSADKYRPGRFFVLI